MRINPNFAAQRLCNFWYGPAYYEGLAVSFAHRLTWTRSRRIAAK
jgi:hypothetical protein